LVAVPVFGWAAYRDIKTRRIPNKTWLPLGALAILLLLWETISIVTGPTSGSLFFFRVTVSLLFVIPLSYGFWLVGGFGGADAKAFMLLALLFPTNPTYYVQSMVLPLEPSLLGVFSITILSNSVLAGGLYPIGVAVGNIARGHFSKAMFFGRPVAVEHIPEEYGRLLESPTGFTRGGLDLDALRMYLQWRGTSFEALRANPERHRNPASLPADPNPPGDGAIVTDGGTKRDTEPQTGPWGAQWFSDSLVVYGTTPYCDTPEPATENPWGAQWFGDSLAGYGATPTPPERDYADPWGTQQFLDEIEGSAYGATPEQLRDGLEVVVQSETVWLSPGIPFIVPTFVGLLAALVYGDVLQTLLGLVGLG
jgi:preflagellin peptidase FlaK